MSIIFVKDEEAKQKFNEFYKGWHLTIEGAGSDNGFQDWFDGINEQLKKREIGQFKEMFIFTGKQMNTVYRLTGSNAYPSDLTMIAIPLDGLDQGKLAMFKLQFGARWFTDIVDNNKVRQKEECYA
jgi:hypothetical protein